MLGFSSVIVRFVVNAELIRTIRVVWGLLRRRLKGMM